jgi:ketosteroid isomerase-like protein
MRTARLLLPLCCLFAVSACFVTPLGLGSAAPAKTKATADDAAEAPVHKDLRAARDAIVEAVNAGDLDALLKHVHENVVVVWQNAEISRGHDGIRAYYHRMLKGPNRVLTGFQIEPTVNELTIIYGDDAGIAYGTAVSKFQFADGGSMDLDGPWSATLVKEGGAWKIAGFHASAGLFDNPILRKAASAVYWGSSIAAVVGLVLGAGIVALLKRRSAARGA